MLSSPRLRKRRRHVCAGSVSPLVVCRPRYSCTAVFILISKSGGTISFFSFSVICWGNGSAPADKTFRAAPHAAWVSEPTQFAYATLLERKETCIGGVIDYFFNCVIFYEFSAVSSKRYASKNDAYDL